MVSTVLSAFITIAPAFLYPFIFICCKLKRITLQIELQVEYVPTSSNNGAVKMVLEINKDKYLPAPMMVKLFFFKMMDSFLYVPASTSMVSLSEATLTAFVKVKKGRLAVRPELALLPIAVQYISPTTLASFTNHLFAYDNFELKRKINNNTYTRHLIRIIFSLI